MQKFSGGGGWAGRADRNSERLVAPAHPIPPFLARIHFQRNVFPIPSGQWPDGTGGSPVLPSPTSEVGSTCLFPARCFFHKADKVLIPAAEAVSC